MKVVVVPVLSDNYAYIVVDEGSGQVAVVDPAEPDKVLRALADHVGPATRITAVWTTHHHADHAGGNHALLEQHPGPAVLGADERIDALTQRVQDGEHLHLGGLHVQVFVTPAHTAGSCCYYVTDEQRNQRAIFTGDTVFTAGCGRFFEGTAQQMVANMDRVFLTLPPDTLMYSGHEYTVANLKLAASSVGWYVIKGWPPAGVVQFAEAVEPHNDHIKDRMWWSIVGPRPCGVMLGWGSTAGKQLWFRLALQSKLAWAQAQRTQDAPTVPSTLGEERQINPFLRYR